MVLPAILTGFFIIDIVVMATTGKDIIQHITGVDVYGYILDPIIDFIWPDLAESGGLQEVIDNQDAWGAALMDMMSILFLLMVVILLITFIMAARGRNDKRR